MKNTINKKNKIISFSLWGQDPKYVIGALRNAELAKEIYPGWIARFYTAASVPPQIINTLSSHSHVQVVHKPSWGDWKSMFWRFEPASEEDVEVMISRDTDSRLNYREKAAVEEWISSDKLFHIMRDHPYHKFPVLGGMWGAKSGACNNMSQLIEEFGGTNEYGTDYVFFAQKVLPQIPMDKIMVHDEFFDKKPFPVKREGNEFVGEVFDEKEQRHIEHSRALEEYRKDRGLT